MSRLIDGKLVARFQLGLLKQTLEQYAARGVPKFGFITVGNRPDSNAYIKKKVQACEELGILYNRVWLKEEVSQYEAMMAVQELNEDKGVHGIMIQLPLPDHLNSTNLVESIDPSRDVDGLTSTNLGKTVMKEHHPNFAPCTPLGCIALLNYYNIPIQGKRAVVIGRSNIAGMPIGALLQKHNATVTICHSFTENLQEIACQADILVSAAGVPGLVKQNFVKDGAAVIDVGISSVIRNGKRKLVGDCEFEECKEKAAWITPVPGGVGPMTVAMLMSNIVQSWINIVKQQVDVINFNKGRISNSPQKR